MDQLTMEAVGIKTLRVRCADCKQEVDRNATACACGGTEKQTIPPENFGRVVEVSPDGKSGYVDLVLTDEQREKLARQLGARGGRGPHAQNWIDAMTKRRFFHVDELHSVDEMRTLLPAEKMLDVERITAAPVEPSPAAPRSEEP